MTDSDEFSEPRDPRGFIYVLTNPAFPGYVKIGHTRASPFQRATDLYTTGVPEPFRVERAWFVLDCVRAEQSVHTALEDRRSASGTREFFSIPIEEAIAFIQRLVGPDLVPEVYASSPALLMELTHAQEDNAKLTAVIREMTTRSAELQPLREQMEREHQRLRDKLERYEEAYEKIGVVDQIIAERNRYRDRYRDVVVSLLSYAKEYERYMLQLGGRYAVWAEEQAEKRPRVDL